MSPEETTLLTTAYTELCRSYQGLREFRMKLLGLLPIASIAGLLVLGRQLPSDISPEVVGYIGIFSAVFTLALFAYEVRSLLMCHDYWWAGANLEAAMGIHGQFARCDERRRLGSYSGGFRFPLARITNDKVTSSLVYSFVFASWFFVGLKSSEVDLRSRDDPLRRLGPWHRRDGLQRVNAVPLRTDARAQGTHSSEG